MDSTRWQKIQALFHETADLPETEQRSFLERACADDPSLIREVLILLEEDARGASMLDADVAQRGADDHDQFGLVVRRRTRNGQ